MSESVARQRLREAREEATAEREAAETQRPSMFRTAVEAAAGALPDAPAATVEQVVLAVLRVALPLHETQHADAWRAAHEGRVHWELEAVKATERAESAEAEVQRYRSFCGEALCGDVERDRDEYLRQNEQLRAELERYRGLDAAAKELLACNVEFGTRADNAEARCEDLEDEVTRLRAQMATDVRTVDATLKAWAVADQAKLSDALLGLREVFIWRIAEAQVRERHAFEDARKAEAGWQSRG